MPDIPPAMEDVLCGYNEPCRAKGYMYIHFLGTRLLIIGSVIGIGHYFKYQYQLFPKDVTDNVRYNKCTNNVISCGYSIINCFYDIEKMFVFIERIRNQKISIGTYLNQLSVYHNQTWGNNNR